MSNARSRLIFWAIPAGALALGLAWAFWPRPVEVDVAIASRGPLALTVAEEGRTRIRDVFVVSSPVRGRALRLDVEVGDEVTAGETVVAEIEPLDPDILDPRTEEEARAAVAAARAALALARAEQSQAVSEMSFAASDLERMRELRESQTVSVQRLEDAERAFRSREAALETATAAVEMRQAQLEAAEARLLGPADFEGADTGCACVEIRAPADGRVLQILHESEGVVLAGAELLEIGDPRDLEVVADFRSEDAVRIEPGQIVVIDGWGGEAALDGRVRRVEPFGFTKVSALGIEEQRVNVLIDIESPPEDWARLSHGFRVEARVVLWQGDDVLTLPITALFRDGEGWRVFDVSDGMARSVAVEVGEMTDTTARILSGVDDGAAVVRYPDERIADGKTVRPRE